MSVPAFSIFSALSEIVVTYIVLATVIGNLRGQPLRWKLLGGCLLFELCVNVMYMVNRASAVDASSGLAAGTKILLAVHGITSLVMFVLLCLLYLVATFDFKAGQPTWFQRHRAGTWAFVVAWLFAVGSGEALFIWRYFPLA